jgi:hypothetical protein
VRCGVRCGARTLPASTLIACGNGSGGGGTAGASEVGESTALVT